MTGKPLVSVIINCYNGEKYLREAIDSVMAQTYENWELVFWDNQSTDYTREIVESYGDPRIHYFYAPEHTSLGRARNMAVEKAKGEYINFLDADDVWMPEKLEKQVALVDPGKVEVIYTNFEILLDEGVTPKDGMAVYYKRLQNRKLLKNHSFYENLLISNFIIFSSILFNKELYNRVGGINESFNQNEDYEILLKCSLKTEIITTGEKDVLYRIHKSNNSSSNGDDYLNENRQIFQELPMSTSLKKAVSANEIRVAISLFKTGFYRKSITHFFNNCSISGIMYLLYNRFLLI